ncbi:MAG: hypothetical protein AB8B63_11455 [Granulosicoccus sp.]
MTAWRQRLKWVFNIGINTFSECGGAKRVIASIEEPAVIRKRYPASLWWRRTTS